MFRKYTSIENTYQERYVSKIIDNSLHDKCEWLVFEKIDGANFSFIYDGVEMRFARRNSILIEGDKFFDYSKVAEKYTQAIIDFYKKLQLREGASVHVFGELYGGCYPDVASSGTQQINKNIFYSPEIDFIVFDVYVQEDEEHGRWMAYNEYVVMLENVPIVEPLFAGSFKEALDYEHNFITKIPKLHGLSDVDGNFAEGIVIKPAQPLHFHNGARIALKKKIEKFSERRPRVARTSAKPKIDHPILDYITEARLHNAISKIGKVTQKDFGSLMKEYTGDILKDYQKEHEVDDKERATIGKIVGMEAATVVRKYFREQSEKSF